MPNRYRFTGVSAEQQAQLRRQWREENLTSTIRTFSGLSQQISELLESDEASDEEIFKLIQQAEVHLQVIRPFFPVISAAEVANYNRIQAKFHAWVRGMERNQPPGRAVREQLSRSLSTAANMEGELAEGAIGDDPAPSAGESTILEPGPECTDEQKDVIKQGPDSDEQKDGIKSSPDAEQKDEKKNVTIKDEDNPAGKVSPSLAGGGSTNPAEVADPGTVLDPRSDESRSTRVISKDEDSPTGKVSPSLAGGGSTNPAEVADPGTVLDPRSDESRSTRVISKDEDSPAGKVSPSLAGGGSTNPVEVPNLGAALDPRSDESRSTRVIPTDPALVPCLDNAPQLQPRQETLGPIRVEGPQGEERAESQRIQPEGGVRVEHRHGLPEAPAVAPELRPELERVAGPGTAGGTAVDNRQAGAAETPNEQNRILNEIVERVRRLEMSPLQRRSSTPNVSSEANTSTSSVRGRRANRGTRGNRGRSGIRLFGEQPTRRPTPEEVERERRIHVREMQHRGQEGYDRDVDRDPTPPPTPDVSQRNSSDRENISDSRVAFLNGRPGPNVGWRDEVNPNLTVEDSRTADSSFGQNQPDMRTQNGQQNSRRARGRSGQRGSSRGRGGTPFRIYVDPPMSQLLETAPEVYFRNPQTGRRREPLQELDPQDDPVRFPYLQVLHQGWIPGNDPLRPHGAAGRLRQEHIEPDRYPDSWPPHRVGRELFPEMQNEVPSPMFPEGWRLPLDLNQEGDGTRSRHRTQQMWRQTEMVPVFEGAVEEYSRWAPLFYEFVHIQPVSIAFKFSILQKTLSTSVKELVMIGLDVSETSYAIAIQRLEKYYGGADRWTQSMLEALERPTRLRATDWTGARQFLNRIEAYTSTTPIALVVDPRHDAMLMALVRRNVPEDWFPQFQTWCIHSQQRPNVRSFIRWASALVDPHLRQPGHQEHQEHQEPGTVPKYSFVCHWHFFLRSFLPNKGGPRSRSYRKALPTVNLKDKEEDGEVVPFIEDELEEIVDTPMEKVPALEEHNYSSNILS